MSNAIVRPTPVSKKTAPVSKKTKTSRYRIMGEGSSLAINFVSIAFFLAMWWLSTHMGWIKPLFLPKPEAI
jgi:taurine transport system permease protein